MSTTTRERGADQKSRKHRRADIEVIAADIDPRIAQRRRKVDGERRRGWRRRWVKAVVTVLVIGLLAGGTYAAFHSPLLDVEIIDVVGSTQLDSQTVAEDAGIHEREPMISVDPGAAASRLRHNPWIERATVVRHWPGVVEIRVDERRATAVLVDGGGKSLAIGTAGIVLGSRYDLGDAASRKSVRSITVDHLPAVAPGAGLSEPMRTAVEVAGAVPASVIPLEVAAALSTDGELTFTLSKGHAIRFGDGSQASDKFLAISTMLSGVVDMTNYCVLDVRTPSSPKVVRAPYCP